MNLNNITSEHALMRTFYQQKQEFNEERRQVLSDCAKRLYRDEPDLWKAATEDYESKYLSILITTCHILSLF